jgi:hypothetical protein
VKGVSVIVSLTQYIKVECCICPGETTSNKKERGVQSLENSVPKYAASIKTNVEHNTYTRTDTIGEPPVI